MKRFPKDQPRSRWILTFEIVAVYYLTLAGLLGLAMQADVLQRTDQSSTAALWLGLLQIYYYVVPVVLAAVFGGLFRPFRNNFRNLWLSIVLIQIAYSFAVFCLQHNYVQAMVSDINQAKLQTIKPVVFKHRFLDEDHDGRIEKVQLAGYVEVRTFPPGEYVVRPVLTQGSLIVTKAIFQGRAEFKITAEKPAPIMVRVEVNPQDFAALLGKGDFILNLALQKVFKVDQKGWAIIELTRWAPFLRTTSWTGENLDIQNRLVDIDYVRRVDSFSLLPLALPR